MTSNPAFCRALEELQRHGYHTPGLDPPDFLFAALSAERACFLLLQHVQCMDNLHKSGAGPATQAAAVHAFWASFTPAEYRAVRWFAFTR